MGEELRAIRVLRAEPAAALKEPVAGLAAQDFVSLPATCSRGKKDVAVECQIRDGILVWLIDLGE